MAENEAGRVSLGIELDTKGIAEQAPKLEKAAEKAGREAGRKLGERAGSEAGKGIEKREPAIRRSFAKAGQRAGDSFTQNVRSGMMRDQSSLMSAAGGIATKLAALFAVKKLFDFGKESISLGSDLAEVQNVVDSTFGAGFQSAEGSRELCAECCYAVRPVGDDGQAVCRYLWRDGQSVWLWQ